LLKPKDGTKGTKNDAFINGKGEDTFGEQGVL
jgi:hypothetical protein